MKIKWLKVLFWVFLFELFFGPLREWAIEQDFKEGVLGYFEDTHTTFLYASYFLVVFLYAMVTYLVLHKFYPKREFLVGIPIWIISVVAVVAIRAILQEVVSFQLFGVGNYNDNTSWSFYFLDNLYYLIVFSFVGAVVYFIQYSKFTERERNELIINNKKTELSFLRSQINPHFLFNSLNNLYSLVYKKSDDALEVVSKLSNMLRYSIYENEEMIPLKKELTYIEDFIELEGIRNDFDLKVELDFQEGLANIEVPPFLLVPFIENAFKHGDLKNEKNPIRMKLQKVANDLVFKISNQKIQKEKDEVGGIGLKNVRKRLHLLFPNQHHLDIKDSDNQFSVYLKIDGIC